MLVLVGASPLVGAHTLLFLLAPRICIDPAAERLNGIDIHVPTPNPAALPLILEVAQPPATFAVDASTSAPIRQHKREFCQTALNEKHREGLNYSQRLRFSCFSAESAAPARNWLMHLQL